MKKAPMKPLRRWRRKMANSLPMKRMVRCGTTCIKAVWQALPRLSKMWNKNRLLVNICPCLGKKVEGLNELELNNASA